MGKAFEPDAVMRSLQKLGDIFEQSGCTDKEIITQFQNLIAEVKKHRWHDFSRKQRWQLEQMQSDVEQKWQIRLGMNK